MERIVFALDLFLYKNKFLYKKNPTLGNQEWDLY